MGSDLWEIDTGWKSCHLHIPNTPTKNLTLKAITAHYLIDLKRKTLQKLQKKAAPPLTFYRCNHELISSHKLHVSEETNRDSSELHMCTFKIPRENMSERKLRMQLSWSSRCTQKKTQKTNGGVIARLWCCFFAPPLVANGYTYLSTDTLSYWLICFNISSRFSLIFFSRIGRISRVFDALW